MGVFTIALSPIYGTGYADVIDFENFPSSPFTSHTEKGVTFSAVGSPSDTCQIDICPNGTNAIAGGQSFGWLPVRADILAGATSVSVDLGDYSGLGSDSETLYLEAFDQAGQSLDRVEQYQSWDDPIRMYTLSLATANVDYVVFGSYGGMYGSGVHGDNFTFQSVPEPSTLVLAVASLLAFALFGWSRRKT